MSKKIKTFAIVILVIALIIGATTFMSNGKRTTQTDTSLSSSKGAGVTSMAPQNNTEFSSLLSTIKGIEIDTSIFSNEAYMTLRDYPVILGSDIIGRPNPFAPIGLDAPVGGSTTEVQFETLQPAKITSTTAEFGAQALVSSNVQTTVIFEFGTSALLGSATSPLPLPKNGTVLFTALGLRPATTYYVRAVLAQGSKTTLGNTMTFTTLK